MDPKLADVPGRRIDSNVNSKAITIKSINQLKEELGPLTEEIKVEVEEAMNEIRSIVKTKRGTIITDFHRKVAQSFIQNGEEERDIRDRVNMNERYLDMDADPNSTQGGKLKRMTKVEPKNLVTFAGLIDVLMIYECSLKSKIVKRLADMLKVYYWRLDCIDFYRFLREVTRYGYNKWDLVAGRHMQAKLLKDPIDKAEVARFIQRQVREVLKKRQSPEAQIKRKEKNQERDFKDYTPKEIIEALKKEYSESGVDCKLQVERIIRVNGGEMITHEKFRDAIYNQLKFVGLSKNFIENMFKKLDPKKTEKASINHLPALIYGDTDANEKILMLPPKVTDLYTLISEAAHFHYDNPSRFTQHCRHAHVSDITKKDFEIFTSSFTRLKKPHSDLLFEYIDDANEGVLKEGQILSIFEHWEKLQKEKDALMALDKSRQDEKVSSLLDLSKNFANLENDFQDGLMGIGKPGTNEGLGAAGGGFDIQEGGDDAPDSSVQAPHNRVPLDELEELAMKIGARATFLMRNHGLVLKPFYKTYADKVTTMMKFDEFKDAITFIISNPEEFNDFEATLHQLFTIVAWPATKEFSWILFKNTIEMGKKINPVYVKLKLKYGEKFNEVKSRFIDEINKLNIKRGDGFVSIFDIKKMFKLNAIEITNLDQEVLIDEGLIVQKDKTNMVEIKPFIEKVFIEHSAFSIYMQKRAISKIFRRYRKYKQEKLVKEQREKNVDAFLEGWGNDESAKGAKLKASPKSKPKPPKKIKPLKSPEERMKNLLPKDDTKTVPSAMTSVHYQKLYKIAEKLINEILDDAVHRGEVNLLRKTVQRRFANRSVSKDNVVTIQEESFSVSNILPRSVSGIPSIGRLFYMSNDALLNQFDLTNNQMLPSVDLSSKIPMQKDEILDYLLDEENAILYVLKMSWILESWNIFQKSRSPSAKVRLVQHSDTLTTLSQVYKNRYLGAFPHLLSLSQSSGQYLIVNSTMVNGTVYFLDPISLSILEQSKPKSEDLNISPQLNKIFYQLKPMFVGSSTTQNSFDRVFGSEVKVNGRMKYIRMETFKNKLLEDSAKLLAEAEIDELVDFLNVNGDDYMDEDEWGFLADNVRISGKKSNVHASYEIPEELRDIDRNVAKIFYDMYDFVQKKNIAIDELFKIFDGNNSGSISEAEFMQIINEISKEANYENKRKFFRFLDKDNSRTIEIEEFCNIFKMFGKYSPQELLPSETPRHEFYVILEKAFEYGLDLEQEFLKYDELKDGGIPVHTFTWLIKNLPFGITDGDIEYYLENILQFTNEGNIDYLSIFTDERFKRIKYIYQIKRGFTEYETMMKDSEDIDKYVGLPKIVIESVIHLSCENVFIYTTVSPKTSNIYIARTKEDKIRDRQLSEVFESQLLAKLIGHKSKEPPTIMFVKESNCLLSGEKLSPIKESMSETMAPQNKSNESFARFYSNITNNKTRVANILVWNLGKDVFNENKTNPPWKISPTRIIENAHYDSITCLAYMPLSQIIVSTSIDGSVKLWDPVARPYSLVHQDSIRKHDNEEEHTQSNVPFSEVSRFYTGELTCYSLVCMNQRVPVPDTDGVPKFKNLEYLVSLELGKAQRTAGKLRTEGIIKVFGIERITIDVPVSRFEETIPKQLWQEMVDLAISNRQNTKFLFKRSLSTNLDKLMSKVVIQKTEVTKIPKLLKSITLDRFVNSENFLHKQELFNLLIHLPMRNPDSNQKMLSIDEVHMHLKRNNFVYPSNLSKEAFVKIVQDIIEKSSHYMVDHRSKNQNKFLNMLSQKISKKEIDIAEFFPKVEYTRNELNRMLGQLGGKDDEIEELLISLDPFYSNIVKLETIKTFFSSEIINSKMNEFGRPNYIITHINAKLSRSNKVELLRNLFSSDSQGTGKVSMLGFLQSFSKLSRTIDENMLKELFELLSDKEEDGEQSMELSYFCKKLLTHSEQFELARVYNALAKIKNALRFRLKTLEDLFVDEDADFKGKSIQNLTVKVGQFIDRIKELDIVGLTTRDLSLVGNFLSSVDEDGNTCISLINLNAYFKKIELKYQYTELSDYKLMVKELKKILGVKEEFRRKWSGVCHREMIGFGEMRILLNHFNINEDIIDLILLKFVESEISSVSFFNKIQAFIEMNSFLDDTSNLRASNVSAIASKLFQEEQNKLEEEKKEMERPRDTMDDLVDLMEKYEAKKTVMSALNVCKKFDKDNTGRVTVPDFVNILWYNLEMSKYGESESVLLAFQNEMIIKNNFKTIEYSEIFDRLESRRAARLIKANTEKELPEQKENEVTLTRVISNISDILRNGHFKLHNAFLYFDRDNIGLILVENFRKILEWGKISLNEEEEAILEDNLMLDNAINYRKFLDLIYINDKHINVQFDAEIWCAISKNFPLELFENLNPHLEALRYYHKLKKDNNPLVSASVLGQILREMSREFSDSDIDLVLKYAVVGSINNLSSALNKLERNDLTWEFEYAHMPHFLTSVPLVLSRKREMPEHKDNATRAFKIGDDKDENTHIISKVKAMLRERGVTMWECIFSCSTDYIEQSRISKYNFLRMLKMIDIDLTMKEKVILVKVLDPQETGRIELNTIIEKFQAEGQQDNKGVREKLVLEKLVYNIYYGGHDLDSAFEAIDKDKKKLLSQKEFGTGLNNLNLDLSMFEINYILGLFGLDDRWSTIKKSDFTKKLKKLMKKHSIDPTSYFSSSLFPQIKNLVDKKNKHLRECFEEEDLHKSGYADLEMMKRALKSFGLSNLRIHHIKTLIKLMDVNMVQESEESSSEDKNDGTMDLGISLEKTKKDEKKATGLDIDDPNFRIDYNELVKAVYEEVENNSKHAIQQANLVLKKVQTQFKMKEFTIFEAYVYFDVNNQNVISNLQFKIGIQNLNANSGQVETSDMKIFWDILDKNNENKVTFNGFFSAFINVGSIDIIKFDEKIVKLLKKFCFLVSKKGSLEEIFKKFDVNQNGSVKLDEFRQQCEKLNLDFKEEELSEIFKVFCNPELINPQLNKKHKSMDDDRYDEMVVSHRAFNFKNLVAVATFFRRKDNMYKLLHRFDSMLQERALSYNKIFEDYCGVHKEKKSGSSAKNPPKKGNKMVVHTLTMTELKNMLRSLKLAFSNDELNQLCDAFESEMITAKQMESSIKKVVEMIEKDKDEKKTFLLMIVQEIEEGINSKNSSLQKIFFEFDGRSDGRLKLDELSQMLGFLKVKATKTEIKAIFEEMDFDRKGNVTIKEFQAFLDQVHFNTHKKDDHIDQAVKPSSGLEQVLKTLQDASSEKQTSLERVIQSQGVEINQIASVKSIEKVFKELGCVLKREDVKIIIEAASKDSSCSWGDLMDWGIKNNIDFRTKEKVYSQFPPSVQVILSKMLQAFKKMNISIETAFKYFTKDHGDRSMKNEFLTLVQGLQIPTSEEELLGLYNFFDERNYGEISKSSFIEKCEIARDFYKWSDNLSDTTEKKGLTTLTLRQHVITILEKLYISFLEKNYNKKQIFAVFDKHGNGIISRDEFVKICENLGMPIAKDYHSSLLNFIDPTESNVINLTSLINKMEESVPEHAKDSLKNTQGQTILRDIVGKLKVHYSKFIWECLDLEKKLQMNDLFSRIKTGISMYDFYRLLATYGIRLQEGDKMILNAAFKNKTQPDYFDTEKLYLAFDKIHKESGLLSDIEGENLEAWESNILRRVADRLRSMNLSLDKALGNIHSNSLGFMKVVDFKQLLFSLDINLSQKDVDLLIKQMANRNNPNLISVEDFKQRFWACFFEGKAQLNPLNIDTRSRQIAGMLHHKIRFEMKMPLSLAWDKLDQRKEGIATIDDLKEFMLEIKMPITKEDLGSLFTLIDQGEDNYIDQFEFMQFWDHNFAADFETKKKKQKNLESEVLGRIVKVLNQSEIDFIKLLRQREPTKGDYLDERQFSKFLVKMGLNIEESKIRDVMAMMNSGNPEKISFNQLETSLLRHGLKARERKNETKVDFSDQLLMTFLNALNLTANKMKFKVKDLVKEYDEDYDGYLTTKEFYNLISSLEKPFKMSEIQRLAHNFASYNSINKISIDKIVQAQIEQDHANLTVDEDLCDGDAFGAVLEHFDPTLLLFRKWSKLKQTKIRFEKFLDYNKDKLRGLRLLSVQHKLKQLDFKMGLILKNIKLVMQYLNNTSTQAIKNEALVKWIDPALCLLSMNKKELQNIVSKQDSYMVNEYSSSQQFNLRFDAVEQFNRFFSIYKGEVLAEGGKESSVRIYTSETLKKISKDGKFFGDHLMYTIKLQTLLQHQYPDIFARIYGYYSRKVGVDPKDRDIYVFYEVLGSEWVSLRDFITSTGGLVRIPFLVTSNSVFHVIKYWFQKILAIVDVCNQNAVCLYLLRPENLYVNHKTLEVKLLSLSGSARISYEGTLSNVSDLNIVLPSVTNLEGSPVYFKEENFTNDPYLAPEFFYTDVTERSPYIDSWSLGAILYFLIFGEDPVSKWKDISKQDETKNTKEPSDYYCYDIFPENLVNEILKHDFGLPIDKTDSLIARSIKLTSFEGVFQQISEVYSPTKDPNQDFNTTYALGSFLDMIQLLMSWKPYERPTAKALLFSKLFKSDKYQEMQMRQFSSLSFFYRSPSKCVRRDILLPLRAMCASIINKPSNTLGFTDQIMTLIDKVYTCTSHVEGIVFQNLSEEFSIGKSLLATSNFPLMDSITQKIRETENKRLKLPNYTLIKFIFENYIMDLLLFAVLRHHSNVNDALALDEISAQNLEEFYYKPIKGFSAILKRMVYDLNSYDTACAPFVSYIMNLLVKFTVGEEFCLASDIVEMLEKDSLNMINTNSYQEYMDLNKQSTLFNNERFFSNVNADKDFLDKSWGENVSRKPYCFWSNHWSFYLCTVATSLMREAYGDAGLGSAHHPVILDYIKFIHTTKKKPGFEAESTIGYFNALLKNSSSKTAEYYSEIMILSNNLVSLEDPSVGTTSLKVIVNYVNTILKAKSIEKVRAVLDSRIFLKCINFLQSDDVHLRETILELIEEATKSFNRDHLYLFEQYDVNSKFDNIMDVKPKSADEIQKNFGLVSHLALTSEDKMDKSNYINCVRNYFAINSKICEKYIRQICMAISLPSFFVSISTILKTNIEILRNKVHCLEIVYNLTNAPYGLLRNLSHSSIDSFSTLAKFFVTVRSGKKNKLNEYLLPYAVKIFKNLIVDSRRDLMKMMENAVGLRTLLREQNLVIPRRFNLGSLAELIQSVDVYFKNYSKDMIKESNLLTISRYSGNKTRVKTEHLTIFESMLKQCCIKIICWLTYESKTINENSVSILQDIIYRFIENIKFYFESMVPHYQTNETITSCMLSISNFLESLVNLGFDYVLMDTVLTMRGRANIEWLMLQIYHIYNYHQALGVQEKPEEDEKLLEFRINKIEDLEERGKELIKFIQNSSCLVKYSNCRIAQSGHSFMRIIMELLEKNDPEYNSIFEATHLVYFISALFQKQYSLLQMFIRTKTESIHVIGRYVEESNLRIRTFEGLLKCTNPIVKQEVLESQMIHRIINTLLASKTELDVGFYRSNYKFLVFRNFLPFRAEALAMISLIFWNKAENDHIYNELVNEIIKANSLRTELEYLRQKKNRLLKLSALSFFSRLVHSGDRHINYLMREQGVYDALSKEFEEDRELAILFRDTCRIIQNMDSVF